MAIAPGQVDHLVGINRLTSATAGAIGTAVVGVNIKPGMWKQVAELPCPGLIDHRVYPDPYWHPVEECHIAAIENEPQFLTIHPPGLMRAVVEVDAKLS